jgi:hypothetical protein
VEWLIRIGVDLETPECVTLPSQIWDELGVWGGIPMSALGYALLDGQFHMARRLLSAGASPIVEHPRSEGEILQFAPVHAIHIVAAMGAEEEVRYLLEKYPEMAEARDGRRRVVRIVNGALERLDGEWLGDGDSTSAVAAAGRFHDP